jgi:nitrogenase molybdenum-iron protein beta chain
MPMLAHTPKEVYERKALRINPAKTCQPIGAMYAALGVHGCLPHSHGSQGCCSYHRSHLTRHFKEPVMASTSSFTEGASVFGGAPNLRQALQTIFSVYDPDLVAVHTTCLSETIGDDLPTIIKKAYDDQIVPQGKTVFHANTPSYVGSHVTGFANMVTGMVRYFAETADQTDPDRINVIPGYVEPSDMREIKRLLKSVNANAVVFPDTSEVLDTPQTGSYQMFPSGGATLDEIKSSGSSMATISLGPFASEPAANELANKCKVPFRSIDLPIGVAMTDKFLMVLKDLLNIEIPDEVKKDRGRLVDVMLDNQHHLFGKKVALWGDPDQMMSLTDFVCSMGMEPVIVITGTPGKRFEKKMKTVLSRFSITNCEVRAGEDLFFLHQWIKNHPVDLLIGNTYGKHIARAEDLPHVRFGFPILDRVGHSYFPTVGYRGGLWLLTKILDTLMDRTDRDAPDERFELVM